jgi:Na+-driven multidrug efflux pump
MVFRGALQGAGDTRFPAWITFICNFALRLPLAWLLAVYLSYGTIGAWIAMASTTVLSAFLMTGWFAIGKWKTIKV